MSLNHSDYEVVEYPYPDFEYSLTVNKSSNSDYEFVTLESSHRPTASNLFRWFRSMTSGSNPENATENIMAMMEVFQSHQDELFEDLGEYVFIEAIVMTCFDLQVDDSDLICQVLRLMYDCFYSFEKLHLKALLGMRGRDGKDLLSFFLEHARRNRLLFRGERMLDVGFCVRRDSAVYLAAEIRSWEQLLVYLQYGAGWEELYKVSSRSYYGVPLAVTEILRTLVKDLWLRFLSPSLPSLGNDPDHDSVVEYCATVDDAIVKDLFRTLRILMRAIRRVRFGSLEFTIEDYDGRNRIASREVITHRAVRVMVPKLYERYRCPEELKHICRWVIRKRLNENWQLPHGIQDLPIPRRLQQYINLLSD